MAPHARVLLPAPEALRGDWSVAPRLCRLLARSDRTATSGGGREAQLLRAFELLPRRLAPAALSRELDAGDARHSQWLRCDPVHLRVDLSTARIVAVGDSLRLGREETEQLLQPLRPLFGDLAWPISAPQPARWYLQLPIDSRPPAFTPLAEVIGDDLFAHLPQGREGQRWRSLLNEAQVILHNHPVNAARVDRGLLPVNGVWCWGAGSLPDHVRAPWSAVLSGDPSLQALARLAGIGALDSAAVWQSPGQLIDLSQLRDIDEIERGVLPELEATLQRLPGAQIELDFADGLLARLNHRQRWRFWRRFP